MIFLMILFLVVIFLLSIYVRNKTNKFANFIKKKDVQIRYEGICRFFVELILIITIGNLINIVYGDFSNVFSKISYAISVIFIVLTFCFILY